MAGVTAARKLLGREPSALGTEGETKLTAATSTSVSPHRADPRGPSLRFPDDG